MGYTHYWNRKYSLIPDDKWKELTEFAKALFKNQSDILAGGDGEGKPSITRAAISFNGIGDESHETCYLPRVGELDRFDFCKTARKPYDAAVVAMLIRASKLGLITWSSDGDTEEHAAGIALEASLK